MSAQTLTVEVDAGSASSWGRSPDRAWMVRLRRADHTLIVAIGLSRTAADNLAERITEVVGPDPAHAPTRSAQQPHEAGLTR